MKRIERMIRHVDFKAAALEYKGGGFLHYPSLYFWEEIVAQAKAVLELDQEETEADRGRRWDDVPPKAT